MINGKFVATDCLNYHNVNLNLQKPKQYKSFSRSFFSAVKVVRKLSENPQMKLRLK